MKAIKNVCELQSLLNDQNSAWQEHIYNETGVLLLFRKSGPILFSSCGHIDLDYDADYRWCNGREETEYCSITSIEEMVNYILAMPSYESFLKDRSYGKFSKAELFWGIYSRVIMAPQNLSLSENPGGRIYDLSSVSEYAGNIDLYMAAVDYDAMNIWLPIDPNLTLNDMLDILVNELNEIAVDLGEPLYKNHTGNEIKVPCSYIELLSVLSPGAEFDWLL